jgi:hypothetical protein
MLTPEEFTVGPIGDVTQLTLVLPIDTYGHACLITPAPGKPTALVVDQKDTFAFFASEGNMAWNGLRIPNISIEIDETSVFDVTGRYPPLGTLVRKTNSLDVVARPDFGRPVSSFVRILANLPAGDAKMEAGFKRWQIVVGEGWAKRVLMTFDTDELNKPRA